MAFLGKLFIFIICFPKVQLYLCIYLFLYLSIHTFYLTIFQRWILFKVLVWTVCKERTLGRAVDKLLNGSRVNSHGQFIFGKQSLSLFRGNMAFHQNRRYVQFLTFSRHGQIGLLFTFFLFFVKVNCPGYENLELNIPFGLNEIYAIWPVHFRRREFFFNDYYFYFLNFYF